MPWAQEAYGGAFLPYHLPPCGDGGTDVWFMCSLLTAKKDAECGKKGD